MACKLDSMRLPKEYDRRIKLTEEDKERVKELYAQGYSQSCIATQFNVSRSLIGLIVNPERMEQLRQYRKENWKHLQQCRQVRTEAQRKVRAYKRDLFLKGLLKAPSDNQSNNSSAN